MSHWATQHAPVAVLHYSAEHSVYVCPLTDEFDRNSMWADAVSSHYRMGLLPWKHLLADG